MTTTTATPEARRAMAQQARLARAARIMQLRRRVMAMALATFVLATGVVAWDGSMSGATPTASSSSAASSSVLGDEPVQSDAGDGSSDVTAPSGSSSAGAESSDASSSADVVTTQQS